MLLVIDVIGRSPPSHGGYHIEEIVTDENLVHFINTLSLQIVGLQEASYMGQHYWLGDAKSDGQLSRWRTFNSQQGWGEA